MALEANYLRVRLDHPGPHGRRLLLCTRRARLAHGGLKVMVGDRVGVEGCDWTEGRAAVGSLEPRRNQLQRPALANVDQVLVVMALAMLLVLLVTMRLGRIRFMDFVSSSVSSIGH